MFTGKSTVSCNCSCWTTSQQTCNRERKEGKEEGRRERGGKERKEEGRRGKRREGEGRGGEERKKGGRRGKRREGEERGGKEREEEGRRGKRREGEGRAARAAMGPALILFDCTIKQVACTTRPDRQCTASCLNTDG